MKKIQTINKVISSIAIGVMAFAITSAAHAFTLNATHDESLMAGAVEHEIFDLSFTPITDDVALDSVRVYFSHPTNEPWDTFENLSLMHNNEKVGEMNTRNRNVWEASNSSRAPGVDNRYYITVESQNNEPFSEGQQVIDVAVDLVDQNDLDFVDTDTPWLLEIEERTIMFKNEEGYQAKPDDGKGKFATSFSIDSGEMMRTPGITAEEFVAIVRLFDLNQEQIIAFASLIRS